MHIVCNGQQRELQPDTNVQMLLRELSLSGPVAVEINDELAPREQHAQRVLKDGDRVEIVTLVGGG